MVYYIWGGKRDQGYFTNAQSCKINPCRCRIPVWGYPPIRQCNRCCKSKSSSNDDGALYGSWYTEFGTETANVKISDILEDLGLDACENTNFYMGTGYYEDPANPKLTTSWTDVQQDQIPKKFQVINIGGYGSCSDGKSKNSYCNIDGPDCVWTNELLEQLPRVVDLKNAGYNAISLDIEAVKQNDTLPSLSKTLQNLKGVKRIITIPTVIPPEHGGMDWLTQDVVRNIDYIFIMYYNFINDTETIFSPTITLKSSLEDVWSGEQSLYKFHPKQIVLGVSFESRSSIRSIITPDVLNLAQGGIGVWSEKGGQVVAPS